MQWNCTQDALLMHIIQLKQRKLKFHRTTCGQPIKVKSFFFIENTTFRRLNEDFLISDFFLFNSHFQLTINMKPRFIDFGWFECDFHANGADTEGTNSIWWLVLFARFIQFRTCQFERALNQKAHNKLSDGWIWYGKVSSFLSPHRVCHLFAS